MIRSHQIARVVAAVLLALALAVPAAAQFSGRINGEVKDKDGKPFPGVNVTLKHQDTGQVIETVTDKYGRYTATSLRNGIWTVSFKYQNQEFYSQGVRLALGDEQRVDVNVKDMIEKMGAAEKEAAKKREEEKSKFESMKAHFDAGRMALDQVRLTRAEIAKTPAAERAPLQEKLAQQIATAVTEFEQARDTINPKDDNLHIVMENLGQAYEEAARYEDAVVAYAKAIEASPQTPHHYTQHGTALARTGKFAEAAAACEKGRAVDPSQAGVCYRNVVIVLQNTGKMTESLEAARKAVEVDPNNAEGHFFLARALVAGMGAKTEGGKIVPVILPGTAEAYQKYLELAPNGRFAKDAQDGLAMLQSLGAPIDTKVKVRSKKP